MIKHHLIILFLLLFIKMQGFSQPDNNDDCSTTFYIQSFTHFDHSSGAQVIPMPSGDVIMGFIIRNFAYVSKFDSRGTIIWSKYFEIPPDFSGFMKGIIDYDGNLIFAVKNYYFFKIDTDGNFLWGKEIHPPRDLYLKGFVMLDNGEKAILFSAGASYGAVITRLDKDMNTVKWSKFYYTFNPLFTTLIADGNDVVLGGFSSETDYAILRNAFLARIDGNDGKVIVSNSYRVPDKESILQQIYKSEKGLIGYTTFPSHSGKRGYIRFDKDLNATTSKFFDTPNGPFLPLPDGSVYISIGESWTLGLIYIDKDDKLKWVKDLPGLMGYPSDMRLSGGNDIYITGQNNYFLVGMNVNATTNYIAKANLNGVISDCITETTPLATLSDFSVVQNINAVTVKDTVVTLGNLTFTDHDYPMVPKNLCSRISYCKSLHIMANTTVCNNLPVAVSAQRNPGCTNSVVWDALPPEVADVTIETDTSISVVFKKSGSFNIKAWMILPCRDTIMDSITINVNLQEPLNLGNDTTICPGDELLLQAGNQFQSYIWQDGSGGESYLVQKSGEFYVTVEDYCGNKWSDTITVAFDTSRVYDDSSHKEKCNSDSLKLTAVAGFTDYQWLSDYNIENNKSRETNVFPLADTTYIITALSRYGCTMRDTVYISVNLSPPLFLGNDTSFCKGEAISLEVPGDFLKYEWNTGATTSEITINTEGTYSVVATDKNGCHSGDTILIGPLVTPPDFTLGGDTILCDGQFLEYHFNLPGAIYLWNDGNQSASRRLNKAGEYWLKISSSGCSTTDTIKVAFQASPIVNLGNDTTLCSGSSLRISAEQPGASYVWQDKSNQPYYIVSQSGIYYVTVTANHCSTSDTLIVNYKPLPTISFDKQNTFICFGQELKLTPEIRMSDSLLWQDHSTGPELTVMQEGVYTLTAYNQCGSHSGSVRITGGNCKVEVPNAFTPNNDGLNDDFGVKYPQSVKEFHMAVYNRFGQKIFETTNAGTRWDGRFKNEDQPSGAYVWVITYTDPAGQTRFLKGTVVLLR